MGRWSVKTLSEVANIVAGSTPKTAVDEYWNGEHNWVTPAELNDTTFVIYETERKITERAIKDTSLKLLPIGTVLLSSRAPIGKVAIAGVEMYCNQGFKNLVCSDEIYNKYLFWFLKGKTEFLNSLGRGATFKEISKTIVEKIEIPLPPLETQKQIAKTLDTAADLLAMRKQQLAELDNLIKSTFYDMFGDPGTNEKGWETGIIKDLALKIQYGTSEKASLENLPYPILRMGNITYQGDMDFSDMKYIDLSEKDKEKYLVHKGEMLFNRTNSKELVGKTAVYREEKPMAYAGYLVRLVPKEMANSELISAYLNSLHGKKLLLKMAKNIVGMANINAQELSRIEIFIPPISLQNQFAEIVTKIEEQKALVKRAIDETQYLFDSLMSEYFE